MPQSKSPVSLPVAIASAALGVFSIAVGIGIVIDLDPQTVDMALGLLAGPLIFGALFLAPLVVRLRHRDAAAPVSPTPIEEVARAGTRRRGFAEKLNPKQVFLLVVVGPLPFYVFTYLMLEHRDSELVRRWVFGPNYFMLAFWVFATALHERYVHRMVNEAATR